MASEDSNSLTRELEQLRRSTQGLRLTLYAQPDPSAQDELLAELAESESKLDELQQQWAAARAKVERAPPPPGARVALRGRFLGERTTGLKVEPQLRIDPLPTGAYHLLDPETDPLLTVTVKNASRDTRRVCVKAFIEGLSAQAVRTIEVEPNQSEIIKLQPTLFPERAREITEVQRATLHVISQDLDAKLESHDTYGITCLARTSSFNAVRQPDTGQVVDLSHYYGAWVTPHAEMVQARIRRAVELAPDRRTVGWSGINAIPMASYPR